MLVEFQDLGRVSHPPHPHFGGMDEAIVMQADVHESAESREVRHDARKLHADLEVVDLVNVVLIEKETGCPVKIISVGPDRSEIVIR